MAKDIVSEVMVRLTPEDYAVLQAIQLPGEPRAHAYLRAARLAVMPPTVVVRYRKDPLFPAWMQMGPLSPLDAEMRGKMLMDRGWTVEAMEVEARPIGRAWPEDEEQEEDDDND